jgi:predicted metal-dependent hydrolase
MPSPATTQEQKQILIDQWYRETIKDVIQSLIKKWEPIMGVKVERFFVQRMKTKWGSCNPLAKSIRLNTDLAKKPPECLEYIVVHEMTHLLEPSHNQRFISLMDEFLPKWRFYKEALNNLPLRHESWVY